MMGNLFGNPYYCYGAGGGSFGWFFMIVFWLVIIWAVVALVRWFKLPEKGNHHSHSSSALAILKERYAKGEINKEEFEAKKKDLM